MSDHPVEADGEITRWLQVTFGGLGAYVPGIATARAISRLVLGAADVPTAGLQWVGQRIRDDSTARSDFKKAVTAAAKNAAKKDPGFADRALFHMSRKLASTQENRDAIAMKVIEHLGADHPQVEADEGPTDDFMNFFSDHAERASSEALRDMFARVLAGEIRRPGTFSLRTLQCISVMDQEVARSIEQVRQWVSASHIVYFIGDFAAGDALNAVGLLEDLSLVRTQMVKRFDILDKGTLIDRFGDQAVVAFGRPGQPQELQFSVAPLTPTGRQIMSLIPLTPDLQVIDEIARAMGEASRNPFSPGSTPRIARVEVGAFGGLSADGVSVLNARIVWPLSQPG